MTGNGKHTSHKNGDDWGCFLSVLPTSPWICWWFSHREIQIQKTWVFFQWENYWYCWATGSANPQNDLGLYEQPGYPNGLRWSLIMFPVWQNWVVSCMVSFSPPARWGSLDFNKGGTLELIHSSLPPSLHPSLLRSFTPHLVTMDAAGHAWMWILYRQLWMQMGMPGPKVHIASAGCCGGLLDPNRCQRECQRECQNRYQIECQKECQNFICQENMSEYSHI